MGGLERLMMGFVRTHGMEDGGTLRMQKWNTAGGVGVDGGKYGRRGSQRRQPCRRKKMTLKSYCYRPPYHQLQQQQLLLLLLRCSFLPVQ